MPVSVVLDQTQLVSLAERVCQARKLYGPDSPFVLGLFAAVEWVTAGTEGGEAFRKMLGDRVVDLEAGKAPSRPAPEAAPPPPGDGLVENNWIKGKVKWFNNDKGYGFISTESNTDVFVHWRDISSWDRSLAQGDEVEFMVTKTAKGFQAINVMKSGKENPGGEPGEGEGADATAPAPGNLVAVEGEAEAAPAGPPPAEA